MEIIPRAEWGARYSAGFGPAPLPAREVWLHHSVTPAPPPNAAFVVDAAAVRALDQIGQDRFGGGISYTFVIPPSGRIFEGHGVATEGAHTKGRNGIARAICLIGNYEQLRPTPAQLDAVAWLLGYGADPARGWWTAARLSGGHRDAPRQDPTACPGANAEAAIPAINGMASATPGRPTPSPTPREDVMNSAQEAKLDRALQLLDAMKPGVRLPGRSKRLAEAVDDQFGWTMTAAGITDTVLVELRELAERTPGAAMPEIDYGKLAAAILDGLQQRAT